MPPETPSPPLSTREMLNGSALVGGVTALVGVALVLGVLALSHRFSNT